MDEIVNEAAPPLLHDVGSAARQLSMKPRGVYDLIYAGRIRSVKVGRLRRIPHEALVEFIANLPAEQKADA